MMLDTKSNTVETVSENGNAIVVKLLLLLLLCYTLSLSRRDFSFAGSNHGSDLYMRFADEPLYQFYAADISEVRILHNIMFVRICAQTT